MLGPNTIGEVLRLLRHRARCSRDQLATVAGVSAGAVSNYENDVSVPSSVTLRRIAVVLAERLEADTDELWRELGEVLDRQHEAMTELTLVRPDAAS